MSAPPERNADEATLAAFDRNWATHGRRLAGAGPPPQPGLQTRRAFEALFSLFPFDEVAGGEGFDLGCGMGRFAALVAPRVRRLHAIDPSAAGLASARRLAGHFGNVEFHRATADAIPLDEASQDFGYSLGVLHHLPDPEAGLRACTARLKPGAPFLLYLYYRFDNRPAWFGRVWAASEWLRRGISRLPFPARRLASDAAALLLYWPLSRAAGLAERLGRDVESWPLAFYRDRPLATLRGDSLDRFGTPIEHRFTRAEMAAMMGRAGLVDIRFREAAPYWVALGRKA